jgi:hypothetical protein
MPFSHYLGTEYVLLRYVPELPMSKQGEVSRHRDRMDDNDGVNDAMKAVDLLAIDDVRTRVYTHAEAYNLKNAVERAYQNPEVVA